MPGEFDMDSAVAEVGGGLGFDESSSNEAGDVELEVTPVTEVEQPATESAEPTAEVPAEVAAVTPDPADAAPKTWRKEASAHWAALPSEIKAEVLKRESDMFQGLEGYKVDATFGKSMKTVVGPYENILRANNMDPVQTVGGLMQSHYLLATGTQEQKAELFQRIAKDYNVDLTQFAGTPAGDAPYIDPAVAALQKELQTVQSTLNATAQTQRAQREAEVGKSVNDFAANTDNIYWGDVADDMAALLSKGTAGTLQEAYDKAVWLNPVTRAKEIARTTAETNAKAAAETKARIDKAKLATAANVRTKARIGSAATPLGSLDDTLEASLAAIKAR